MLSERNHSAVYTIVVRSLFFHKNKSGDENYTVGQTFVYRLFKKIVAIIDQTMKPNLVADEMFPEGAGPFMELDEVCPSKIRQTSFVHSLEIYRSWLIIFRFFFIPNQKSGGSSGLLMDLAANEKDVHSDFYNGESTQLFSCTPNKYAINVQWSEFISIIRFLDFDDLCEEDEEIASS